MCGLVGVAGDLNKIAVDVFTNLLYFDTVRGSDSTGVAAVTALKDISVLKQVGPALPLIERKQYDVVVNPGKYCLIGHNRYGTVGQKTESNAHPFHHDNIVGAHNGTIPWDARKRLDKGDDFGTDSEAIIYNIAQHGVEETVAKLTGAWAVVFYDRTDNSINFFRNKERPLYYGFSKDRSQLFWASEYYMLLSAIRRNGAEVEKIEEFPKDQLMYWQLPKMREKFGEGAVVPLKEYTAPPVVSRFLGFHERNHNGPVTSIVAQGTKADDKKATQQALVEVPWDEEEMMGWTEAQVEAFIEARSKDTKVVTVAGTRIYKNPKTNSDMSRAEFDDIVKAGCDWCSQSVDWGTAAKFQVDSIGNVECFCEECVEGRTGLNRYLGAAC